MSAGSARVNASCGGARLGDLHRAVGGVDEQAGGALPEALPGGVGEREQDVGALAPHRPLDRGAQARLVVDEGGGGRVLDGQRGAAQHRADAGEPEAREVGGERGQCPRDRRRRVAARRVPDARVAQLLLLLEQLDEVQQVVGGLSSGCRRRLPHRRRGRPRRRRARRSPWPSPPPGGRSAPSRWPAAAPHPTPAPWRARRCAPARHRATRAGPGTARGRARRRPPARSRRGRRSGTAGIAEGWGIS